jgi:DNA polymerase-1
MLFGFSTMLIRLWEGERPRSALVAWDTLEVPTYRHEELAVYQSGREFDDELLEQLNMLPAVVASIGFAVAKAPGYEADDFLGAAVSAEEAAGGSVLVATSDRDAFQLASAQTTILQPVRGEAPNRIGPDEVRERYGVDPEQVPDFIALRGDPSDKIPGARGVGPKGAADLLAKYRTLEEMLDDGRFAAEADALRLYRRVATLDREAPLPPLPDAAPDWAAAADHARKIGMERLATRFLEAAA